MLNLTLVTILTDRNSDSISLFDELKRFYNTLKDVSDNFELIVINTCHNERFNNDLTIFCSEHNYCKVRNIVGATLRESLKTAISITEYENVLILNSDVDCHPIDLDYIIERYSSIGTNNCFALFENNNSNQSDTLGVVCRSYDLMQVVNYINAKSMTEFFTQMCMLYYYIGKVYRVNNRISHFQLYKANIAVSGFKKLRLKLFLKGCQKMYTSQYKFESIFDSDGHPAD